MAFKLGDRVKETTTSTGTGAITFAGAVAGFRAFSSVLSDGDLTSYFIQDDAGNWESGTGTYAAGANTLTRTKVLASSNFNSAVSFAAGTKSVFIGIGSDNVGPELNARTFGVKADGTTDDLAAIQRAMDAASAAGGGVVILPPGNCKVTGTINLKSFVTLRGSGSSSSSTGTTITTTSTTLPVLRGLNTTTSLENIVVENLSLQGPGSGSGHGIYLQNTGSAGVYPPFVYASFRDLYIANFGGTGFRAESLIVSVLERVVVETCGHGFYLIGQTHGAYTTVNTSVTFTSCYANNNTGNGYWVDYSTYMAFVGCAADSNGTGYLFDTVNVLTTTGCGAEYGATPTSSPGNHVKVIDCNQITFTGFYAYQNAHYAFWVTGTSTNILFMGCEENSPLAGAVNSFKVDAGCFITLLGTTYAKATSVAATANLSILQDAGNIMRAQLIDYLSNTDGKRTLAFETNAAAVNYISVRPASTGQAVNISAIGSDTDVYLNLIPKGVGTIRANGVDVATISDEQILTHKRYGYIAKTANYTLTAADQYVLGDATGGAFQITLPTAVGSPGRLFTVKKIDVSANAVTVGTTSAQTIDGAATYGLATQYKSVTVLSDGAHWYVVGAV
jgi:hypothetical protein